jgi:hypothetical protein
MTVLKPWAYGPFELIVHAEMHILAGEDFDRRLAMIGFDNAIEVAITTYLGLHPIQRGNRVYPRADVDRWLANYHTKIDFVEVEFQVRNIALLHGKDEIVWFHEVRNGQYHAGGAAIPQGRELQGVRAVSMQIFSVLFDEPDPERLVSERIAELSPHVRPERDDEKDRLIDEEYGTIRLAGKPVYTSELLYAWDPFAYSELARDIATAANLDSEDDE